MGNLILATLLLLHLPTELLSIQVVVTETERRTMLFGSVTLRCDYSTSANAIDVLVTWRFKSFCKDPVLEYYSTAYQAALQLGQDPANDCPDRQRTVRTVVQKRGLNEPILGAEYRNRKITIQDKADLVITEVMWWDNGVYFCTIDAAGDTTGDSDREIKLIVLHWLTVLLILLGAVALMMLFCICCCQCCPQRCCCYVRCPCCPRTCCCPEKVVMQHRMLREAKRAMVPWMNGQPLYAPISSAPSSQGVPILYSGSYSDYPTKNNFAMAPMQLEPQYAPPLAPPPHGNHQVLDYLENQVRGLDVGLPPMAPHAVYSMAPLQAPPPAAVPYATGPPSMLSALDEAGVRGMERRVITLPPIIQRAPGSASRRGGARISSQSSGSTDPSGGGGVFLPRTGRGYRDVSPPRRGILREYGDDSDCDRRRGGAGSSRRSRNERGSGSAGRRGGGARPRARSRDDLMEEGRGRGARRERSYSPPPLRRRSWSSEDDGGGGGGMKKGGRGGAWPEKPPSYSSIEIQSGRNRNYLPLSDRSSRSSTSVVI
ncbi:unnamed protein product [Ophioblennius macclurei]